MRDSPNYPKEKAMTFEETFEQMSSKEQLGHTIGMQTAGTIAGFAANMLARKLYTAAVLAYKAKRSTTVED